MGPSQALWSTWSSAGEPVSGILDTLVVTTFDYLASFGIHPRGSDASFLPTPRKMASRELTIVLTRPSTSARLGIRLISEQPDQPPYVTMLNPVGVAAGSALRIGDQVLYVDGQVASNSEVAVQHFARAGTTVRLHVRRAPRTVTIARNKLGLGLSVDSTNRITALYEGSAAAEHGGLAIGDRVIAVNGQPLAIDAPLAQRIPSGAAPFQLTLLAVGDDEEEVDDEYETDEEPLGYIAQGPSGEAYGSSSSAPRQPSYVPAVSSSVTPTRGRVPSASQPARSASFSKTQLFELQSAFEVLSGSTSSDARIGPSETLAAVTHFERDATLDEVTALCVQQSGRADGMLDFATFTKLMLEVRGRVGHAHAIFDTMDTNGVGCVTQADAARLIKALATSTAAEVVPTDDDVAAMLAMLRPGPDGLVHRKPSLEALSQALQTR